MRPCKCTNAICQEIAHLGIATIHELLVELIAGAVQNPNDCRQPIRSRSASVGLAKDIDSQQDTKNSIFKKMQEQVIKSQSDTWDGRAG